MLRKTALIGVVLVLCAGIIGFAGQGNAERQGRGQRGGAGMTDWFDQLEKAHAAKDMDKIGELIGTMKERRQQSQSAGERTRTGGGEGAAGARGGGERPAGARGGGRRAVGTPEELAAAEKKIKDVQAYLEKDQRQGMMNVPAEDGLLLRILTEAVGARRVVEVGTSNGYSGLWFSLALQRTGGQLITHEIDEGRFKLAKENFEKAGVSDIVTMVFGDAHDTVEKLEGSIDILFLDADKDGYMDYMEKLLPKVRPGGLILAHNTTNAGADMADYIKKITTDKDLVTIFLHEAGRGLSTTVKKR